MADNGSILDSPSRDRRHRVAVLLCLFLLLLVSLALQAVLRHRRGEGCPAVVPVVREMAVFDTYARLTLWAPPAAAAAALDACAEELGRLHAALNRYDPRSELSRLNRTAAEAPFVCSELLWSALCVCREAHAQTEGAFDASVGPLMELWGFHRKRDALPSEAEIVAVMGRVGFQRLVFDDGARSVRFTAPGVSLDLGGMAKGFALDRLGDILTRRGVACALVDLGGNILCTAEPPPARDSFVIGVRNPFDAEGMLGRFAVTGRCVATSGNYERRIVVQGRTIGHIIDPRTGRPAGDLAGVTAVTRSGADSDVFSTAVYVAGRDLAERLAAALPGTGFVLVDGTPESPRRAVIGALKLLE
ncbi:MAG: FAD:protein FMN transferase [Lentisphaeria bacterium]|nr:FAD:protein FMN transferase [Lentisphaeria bacterium]